MLLLALSFINGSESQQLARAYETGRQAGMAVSVLVIAFAIVMVALWRWRRRSLEAERRAAMVGEEPPLRRKPFAAVFGAAIVAFVGLALLIPITMKRALESDQKDDRLPGRTSEKRADEPSLGEGALTESTSPSANELDSIVVSLDESELRLRGRSIARADTQQREIRHGRKSALFRRRQTTASSAGSSCSAPH